MLVFQNDAHNTVLILPSWNLLLLYGIHPPNCIVQSLSWMKINKRGVLSANITCGPQQMTCVLVQHASTLACQLFRPNQRVMHLSALRAQVKIHFILEHPSSPTQKNQKSLLEKLQRDHPGRCVDC